MREKMHLKKQSAAALAVLVTIPASTMAKSPSPPPGPPPPPAPTKVNGSQWFDWWTDTNVPAVSGYLNSPRLTNANAAAINTFLTSGLPAGAIRAVKVEGALSTATTNLIFNNPNYNVSYVFGDIETGASSPASLTQLVNQVRWVNGTVSGTKTKSNLAYVGGFAFSTITNDRAGNGKKHSTNAFDYSQKTYVPTGANMSNPDLYPGDPGFRNYAAGDSTATQFSPPNIRTSLFVLPLMRMGQTTDGAMSNGYYGVHQQVPFITNFNNWYNPGMANNRTLTGPWQFTPGQDMIAANGYPFVPASKTANQMLSPRDFAYMVAHIRLRGADSYHLLEDSGVVGISAAQQMAQAKEGWTEPHIAARMSAPDKRLLIGNEASPGYGEGVYSGGTAITVDGNTSRNIEQAGSVFSGVYSVSQGKLDILMSNMDEVSHKITLPSTVGGYALSTKDFTMQGGTHMLIEYSLSGSKTKSWGSYITTPLFADLDNDRNRPGVPEPGMLSLVGVAAMYGATRRRRRTADVA